MTLDDLKSRHSALLGRALQWHAQSVSYDGKSVNYGSDAELAAAVSRYRAPDCRSWNVALGGCCVLMP
jgi:hypothetical protein